MHVFVVLWFPITFPDVRGVNTSHLSLFGICSVFWQTGSVFDALSICWVGIGQGNKQRGDHRSQIHLLPDNALYCGIFVHSSVCSSDIAWLFSFQNWRKKKQRMIMKTVNPLYT